MKIIGIDDAGRGPVLGPMILAGVIAEESQLGKFKELGACDSKLLTKKDRKTIHKKITDEFKYYTVIAEPKEIDEFPNLNHLEAIKTGIIINYLTKDLNEKVKVIIDCPSVNIKSWTEYLQETIIKKNLVMLQCEHKADFNHAIVGAASIVAKEKREDEIKKLKAELGINFGSGYPADPVTKEFLIKNFGKPKYNKLIRKSWQTYKKLADKMDQKKLFYL